MQLSIYFAIATTIATVDSSQIDHINTLQYISVTILYLLLTYIDKLDINHVQNTLRSDSLIAFCPIRGKMYMVTVADIL